MEEADTVKNFIPKDFSCLYIITLDSTRNRGKPVLLESFPFDAEVCEFDDSFESAVELSESEDDDVTIVAEVTASPKPELASSSKNTVYYRCEKCSYQTRIRYLFDRHVARHALGRPFQCTSCEFSDYDHNAFVDHWVEQHQQTKVIGCAFCSFKCSSAGPLKLHIPEHRMVEVLDCSMCEFSSNHVNSMKHHIEVFHTKIYKCEYCDKILTKHMLIKHSERVHGGKSLDLKDIRASDGFGDERDCDVSDQTDGAVKAPGVVNVETVVSSKSNSDCPDQKMSKPESDEDVREGDEVRVELRCLICAFTTQNKLSLKYHVMVFHKKKIECDHCSVVMTKHDLIQHVAKEHAVTPDTESKDQPISSGLQSEQSVAEEMDRSSVQVMRYSSSMAVGMKCSYCEYSATETRHLDKHVLRLHGKKYQCDHCSLVMTKHELFDHCKNVHSVTLRVTDRLTEAQQGMKDTFAPSGDKESECSGVGEPTQRQDMSDTDGAAMTLKCSFCDYYSNRRISLNEHEFKLHTKKYHCNQCPVIMTKYELIEHCQVVHRKTIRASGRCTLKAARQGLRAGAATSQPNYVGSEDKPGLSTVQDQDLIGQYTSKCPFCEYASLKVSDVEGHIMRLHTVEYSCKFCCEIMTKHEIIKHCRDVHGVIIGAVSRWAFNKVRSRPDDIQTDSDVRRAKGSMAKDQPVRRSNRTSAMAGRFACLKCKFSSLSAIGLYKHTERSHKKTSRMRCSVIKETGRVSRKTPARHLSKGLRRDADSSKSETNGSLLNGARSNSEQDANTEPGPHANEGTLVSISVADNVPSRRFHCGSCEFTTPWKRNLQNHKLLVHNKLLSCDFCPAKMARFELIEHAMQEHSFDMQFQVNNLPCDARKTGSHQVPSLSSDDPSVKRNHPAKILTEVKRYGKTFYCSVCQLSSNYRKAVERHIMSFHSKKRNCKHCSAVMTQHELIKHSKKVHGLILKRRGRPPKRRNCVIDQGHTMKSSIDEVGQHGSELEVSENPSLDHSKIEPGSSSGKNSRPSSQQVGVPSSKDSFSKDKAETQNQSEKIICTGCNVRFHPHSIERHMLSFHSNVHPCEHCSAVMTLHELNEHSKEVHGVILKTTGRDCLVPNVTATEDTHDSNSESTQVANAAEEVTVTSSDRVVKPSSERVTTHLKSKTSAVDGEDVKRRFLQCETCEWKTLREDLLERHVAKHAPLECPLCGLECGTSHAVAAHIITHNQPQTRYKCFYCGFIAKRLGNLTEHLSQHVERLKQQDCPECEFSCFRPDNLRQHIACTHGKKLHVAVLKNGERKCLGRTVANFEGTGKTPHEFLVTSRGIYKLPKQVASNTDSRDETKPSKVAGKRFGSKNQSGLLQCRDCSYETKIKSLMRRHVKLHLPESQFVCPKCDLRESSSRSFAKHLKSHDLPGAAMQCCFCSFSTSHFNSMHQHLCIHRPVGSFYCKKCEFSCAQVGSLKKHYNIHHVIKRACRHCPKVATVYKLYHHNEKCHPESKGNGGFSLPVHKPVKKGRCDNAGLNRQKRIAAKQAFRNRISMQHDIKCRTCEYKTAREDLLKRHEAKHSPLECPVCDMRFGKGHSFTVHLSQHNPQDSPFKCFYCGDILKHLGELYRHLSLHVSALKIHDCSLCEFSCLRHDHLLRHMSTHSKKYKTVESGVTPSISCPDESKTTKSWAGSSNLVHREYVSVIKPSKPDKTLEKNDYTMPEVNDADIIVQLSGRAPHTPCAASAVTASTSAKFTSDVLSIPGEINPTKAVIAANATISEALPTPSTSAKFTRDSLSMPNEMNPTKAAIAANATISGTQSLFSGTRNVQMNKPTLDSQPKLQNEVAGGISGRPGLFYSLPGVLPAGSSSSVCATYPGTSAPSYEKIQHRCPHCTYWTMRYDLFRRHVAKHKPLVCPVCFSSIADHSRFTAHMVHHNPSDMPYKCYSCGIDLKNEVLLFYHLAKHISTLAQFDCAYCDYSSLRRDTFQSHMANFHWYSLFQKATYQR